MKSKCGGLTVGALSLLALAMMTPAYGATAVSTGPQEGSRKMAIQLSSSAFEQGGYIPKKYTGEGLDVSPPLKWTAPPSGAKTFALICDDPDAPSGTWVHWVAWSIPADARELQEAIPRDDQLKNGMKQGTNSFPRIGYGGPMPPRGSDHRYFFKIYALDNDPVLPASAGKKELLETVKGHILAEGELMGRYKR